MNMDLRQKIGQLMMVGFPGRDLQDIEEAVKRYKLGNFVLFSENIGSKSETQDLLSKLREITVRETGSAPLISLDQECGMVQRIYRDITFYSGNMAVGASGDDRYAYEIGKMLGAELRDFGFNMNIAPDVDVNRNPKNPVIGVRSYGSDPHLVAEMGLAMAEGLTESLILPCFKHFPGHGDVAVDSHCNIPVVSFDLARLAEVEFYPFQRAVDAGAECIMAGHLLCTAVDPEYPATYSRKVLTDLLRGKLGYRNLIVTDCLEMGSIANGIGIPAAAERSLLAGADMIEISHRLENHAAVAEHLYECCKNGLMAEDVIGAHVETVQRMKRKYCGPDTVLYDKAQHERKAKRIADHCIVLESGSPFASLQDTVFLCVKNDAGTIVEDKNLLNISLIDAVRNRFGAMAIDFEPQSIDVDGLLEKALPYRQIVLALGDAQLHPEQLLLYDRLKQAGHDIVVVSMRTPYDMQGRAGYRAHILCGEYTQLSVDALMEFIKKYLKK